MIKNLENNKELKQIVTNILLEGKKLLCVKSDPAINMGMMFGILSDKENMVCISNIIFETYLYNHVIAGKMREQKYRQKGLEQLEKYLDSRNSQKGYLVSFNFNKEKTYVQNMVILENSQKEVYEIVV